METPKPKKDPLFRIKYMGYFLSGNDSERDDIDFNDLVKLAKFNLAEARGVLMEDPVWDRYTPYQILVEYYAIFFRKNEDARNAFQSQIENGGGIDEEMEWLHKAVDGNRSTIEKLKTTPLPTEEVVFDPEEE